MSEMVHPTPYADVNAVVYGFLTDIQTILGGHFRGMYLCGSLALGDFDPRSSDIDLVVVTDTEISDDLFEALKDMHEQFNASGSPWVFRVEAVYVPQDALRNAAPASAVYPQIEQGTKLFKDHLESGWVFQCYILRERGVVIAGPDPHTLVGSVDPSAMRRAVPVIPNMWREHVLHDPSWLDWVRQRENQAFVVLTLCRLLYTLDTAAVASKPAAARWAQKALDSRWAGLIERSLAGQRVSSETPDSDMEDTVALIHYTVERGQQQDFLPPPTGHQ